MNATTNGAGPSASPARNTCQAFAVAAASGACSSRRIIATRALANRIADVVRRALEVYR